MRTSTANTNHFLHPYYFNTLTFLTHIDVNLKCHETTFQNLLPMFPKIRHYKTSYINHADADKGTLELHQPDRDDTGKTLGSQTCGSE